MGFIEDIKNCFSLEEFPKEPCYRAVLFGDRAVYLENINCIVHYSPEEVVLSFKGGGIRLTGEDMYIKKYCAGDVVICGKTIKVIERL